ncbi:diaminopimelate epimerase [Cognatiluteimonas weifangensis]|uniref:Diaminopimelate epimerase n=1 Tax=Cognatiluteimonas weifangensis TaxID=2303539 RepID=A0A372DPV7_9GAMM|nr:diaminopimelate epimerase [Luteimonas weifangensis]RFP61595.1 diaminopimelate epimerase [Luteimonas weifangensis]
MGAAPRPLATPLRFTKMHGAGNDFVVLDLRAGAPPPSPALSRALADRHTGVGCDQILTVEPPRSAEAVAAYRIWNADGSPAQQCGNGARCIAAWLVRDGAATGTRFVLDSPAGRHAVERLDDGHYRIAMGVPQFAPQALPLLGFDAAQDEYALAVDGRQVRFGAVSMGNPHALIEVEAVEAAPVAALGAALQAQAAFPQSVNVGFVQVQARDRIRLRVYERGAGETRACGSGACAAAAILMRRGRIDREVAVVLPGGTLRIGWREDDAPLTMAGPAAFVFEGEFLA